MQIQTDLNSFSFKIGTLVPWCKNCGMRKLHKDGKINGKQRYECNHCGYRFVWSSDLPKRQFNSNMIAFVADLYSTVGISLRKLAAKLKRFFKIKISHECIRLWNIACSKLKFPKIEPAYSPIWHADETYFKTKGKGHWLWIVYCNHTGAVISWHISKSRFFKDAKAVLQKALDNAGMRPERIITDGLYQYDAAIKKVFGWKWNVQKKNHIKDSGFGKNAILERFNREIKRRIKWFSTFQSLEGANAFFNLFFYHYNFYHMNRRTKTTPVALAGIKEKPLTQLLRCFPAP